MDSLLKPIGRRTYFVGLLVMGLLAMVVGFGFMAMNMTTPEDPVAQLMPLLLFLSLIRLIWDYKRIKDISPNPTYFLLLIIPLFSQILNLALHKNPGVMLAETAQSGAPASLMGMTIMLGVVTMLGLFYSLFLLLKKGHLSKTQSTS